MNWILLDSPGNPDDSKEAVAEFSNLIIEKLTSLAENADDNSETKKAFTVAVNAVLEAERGYL